MYQLKQGEPAGIGAKRIGLGLIDDTLNDLVTLAPDIDSAVHAARKNGKKLRALLRLVRTEMLPHAYRAENQAVRDLSRALAPLRDSAVVGETLDRVTAKAGENVGQYEAIRSWLEQRRIAARARYFDQTEAIAAVVTGYGQLRARWEAVSLHNTGFDLFSDGLARTYRQGLAAMRQAMASEHDSERFHEWRKQVKYLWHQAEILRPIWPEVLGAWERELHLVSDFLGDAHDLAAAEATILDDPTSPFHQRPDLAGLRALFQAERRDLETKAAPYGQRLYTEKATALCRRLGTYYRVWQEQGINGVRAIDGYIDTKTAAAQLEISTTQVRQRLARGDLNGVKIGGIWLVEAPP